MKTCILLWILTACIWATLHVHLGVETLDKLSIWGRASGAAMNAISLALSITDLSLPYEQAGAQSQPMMMTLDVSCVVDFLVEVCSQDGEEGVSKTHDTNSGNESDDKGLFLVIFA